jgi:NAD(P)H-hydrate epimerase
MSVPLRDDGSRKGENGKVGVIAGSARYTGAPALCAKAAMRSGADLVKVLTSEKTREVVAGFSKDLIVEGYSGDFLTAESLSEAEDLAEWSDVVVAGPGLGEPDYETLSQVVDGARCVLDADAIHETVLESDLSDAVITPHRGEAEKLGDMESFASRTGAVVLAKGPTDKILSPRRQVSEVERGHPTMTVGGTGDVLAGAVGGFMAQDMEREAAAEAGARAVGIAGELAANNYGCGALASDILERIPDGLDSLDPTSF